MNILRHVLGGIAALGALAVFGLMAGMYWITQPLPVEHERKPLASTLNRLGIICLLVAFLAFLALCAAQAQGQTIQPAMAVYDVGQIGQAKTIALGRQKAKLPPLLAILNPDSGPSTDAIRKPFLAWQPSGAVINAGYVDLDDEDGNQRQATDVRKDVLTWRAAKVPMIFLDDCHAWNNQKQAEDLAALVWAAIKDTGYTTDNVILNAGGLVGKRSAWMRAKSYVVCDFEDPINKLDSDAIGSMWLGFVTDRATASDLVAKAKAKKTVRFIGFDNLSTWKKPGKEWQTQLAPDIAAYLMSL